MKRVIYYLLIISCGGIISCDSENESTPQPPTQFSISIDLETNGHESARINWTPSIDPDGTTVVYDVLLDELVQVNDLDTNSYLMEGLDAERQYAVLVIARDESSATTERSVTFTTLEAPMTDPSQVTISFDNVSYESATITWTESIDPDGTNVVYDVYLNDDVVITNLAQRRYVLEDLLERTEYGVAVIAKDENNGTAEADTTFITPEEPNSPPGDFSISVDNIQISSADVTWTEAIDPEGDLVLYDLYINDALEASNIPNTSYTFSMLAANTEYEIGVVAKDEKGTTREKTVTFTTENK